MIASPPRDVNRVAICIATMCRPKGLTRLLRSLDELRFSKHPTPDLTVVVCDNDPAGSAAAPVRSFSQESALTLRYVHELQRGISFARNACIRSALDAGAEAVAFVDDDESADPGWLDELLATRREFDAHVVTGPVIPDYDECVPDWIIRARFFERPDHKTGTLLPFAAAGNVLAVREVVDAVGCFDGRLALSGGEDSHFFWRARAAGARIVWTGAAVVRETVPLSRARVEWLVRRAYRLQSGYVFCERDLLPFIQWMPHRLAKTVGISVRGIGRIAVAPVFGRAMLVRGLCDIARAVGATAGACGALYNEYRTIHGQ